MSEENVDGQVPSKADPQDGQPSDRDEVQSLRRESAKYRNSRNEALRWEAALRAVCRAHNIDLASIPPGAVQGLAIEDGKVVDEFRYEPPKLSLPSAPSRGGGGEPATTTEPLTKSRLREMSRAEIDRLDWDEIKAVLED